MQLLNTQERYGVVAQVLHWLTAALVVLAWLLGQFGDSFPRGPSRDGALTVHMTAGLLIVMALIVRLSWRMVVPRPLREPTPFDPWAGWAATLGHAALYLLLVAVPVLGIVTQFARGNPLPVFGLFTIASPWVADRAFGREIKELHEWAANALIFAALLHAAAAFGHHWLLKDRTLRRMLPWTR